MLFKLHSAESDKQSFVRSFEDAADVRVAGGNEPPATLELISLHFPAYSLGASDCPRFFLITGETT
jgi:hypothetical protein